MNIKININKNESRLEGLDSFHVIGCLDVNQRLDGFMHACSDTGVTVDALEAVPLDLFLVRVNLDGSAWTCSFTVLTLVAFRHVEV